MVSKVKYNTAIFLIILLIQFLNSCQKDQPVCRGNCANISINGDVSLITNGTALSNVPVEVIWFRNAYCFGCTSYKVASGKSGSDGKFSFNATIDTTFFKDYCLSVRVPADTNYISAPGVGGVRFKETRFYDFNLSAFQNIQFEFYQKAFLTIKLRRTQNDNFDYFSVDHNFTTDFGYGDLIITGQQFATDTTLQVKTAANIFTRILSKKTTIAGQSSQQIDSLVCTSGGSNVFTLNY